MSNYFNKRLIDLLKADIKRSKRLEKNIRSGYKLAKGLIEADIEKYTSRITDELELDLNKLNKKLSIEDMKVLAQSLGVSDDFYASYANLSYMEAIRLEMAKSIRKLADDNESLIYKHLAATFEDNYYTTCYELYKTMDDFAFKKRVTNEYFDFLAKKPWTADGKTFSQKIWSNQERLINEMSREFVVSATRGANIKESAKRLSQRMDIDYKRCVRLLNTEDSFFSNQAVLEAYKNTTSEQYRILATLDSRTCDVCGSVDLKVFNIKDARAGINLPPFHPNCRCTTTIYFEDDEEADERIMRDKDGKSVKDEFMSYDEWKKKYVDKVDETKENGYNKDEKHINKKSEIFNKIGEEHYNNLHKILKEAPELQRNVWLKHEDDLQVYSATSKVHPRFMPGWGIEMDVSESAKGSSYEAPYQSVFHEFGHNIDYILNSKYGDGNEFVPYSYTYKNNLFGKTIKSEISERIDTMTKTMKKEFKENINDIDWLYKNKYITDYDFEKRVKDGEWIGEPLKFKKAYVYRALRDEIVKIDEIDRANLSDIVEGATKAKVQAGFGHGKKYWNRYSSLSTETFAEMFDASIANQGQLEAIKKYLPKSYEIFEEILKSIMEVE